MNMIDQAKQKRDELEKAIGKLVRNIEDETCLTVVAITDDSLYKGEFTTVKIEVALSRGMSKEYNKRQEKEWEKEWERRKEKKEIKE